MSIGENLRKHRKKMHLTLKGLADKSNVSLTFISDIENGRRKPSFEKAKALADALEIDIELLLDETDADVVSELKQGSETILNPDIRAIARAAKNLSNEESHELRQFAERLFPDAFKKK